MMEPTTMEFCSMLWHGPGGKLELTPMINESTSGVFLEHITTKLNELSARGWTLHTLAASRGQWMYVLVREKLVTRRVTPPPPPQLKTIMEEKDKKKDKKDKKKKKDKKEEKS